MICVVSSGRSDDRFPTHADDGGLWMADVSANRQG